MYIKAILSYLFVNNMVFCDNVIDEIECALDRSSGLLKSIKLDGVIGISLFYLYRYLESYNHKYITKIESQLDL